MARFENMSTTVKGFIVDPIAQTFEPFEVQTSYTRSNEKAAKLAAEMLEIEAPKIVSISELVNPKAERKNYNNSKIMEFASNVSYEEVEGWHKAIMYHVSGFVWSKYEGEFETQFIEYDTPTNLTKVNLRQSIAEKARENGREVYAVADENKEAFDVWCEIDADNLEKCEVKKQD